MTALCGAAGCDQIGLVPGEIDGRPALLCFAHSGPILPPVDGPTVEAEEAPTFHEDVTAGLAALILEHTAMTVLEVDDATGGAMRSMSANTGLPLDVCAGILLATTWIMAAGQVDDTMLLRGAELLEAQADQPVSVEEAASLLDDPDRWDELEAEEIAGAEAREVVDPCPEHGTDFDEHPHCAYCSAATITQQPTSEDLEAQAGLVGQADADGDDGGIVAACDLCGRTDDHEHQADELDEPAHFGDDDDDQPRPTAFDLIKRAWIEGGAPDELDDDDEPDDIEATGSLVVATDPGAATAAPADQTEGRADDGQE